MKVSVRMAIMSHMSDIQESLYNFNRKSVTQDLNFCKRLLIAYPDINVEVETEELDKIWEETHPYE